MENDEPFMGTPRSLVYHGAIHYGQTKPHLKDVKPSGSQKYTEQGVAMRHFVADPPWPCQDSLAKHAENIKEHRQNEAGTWRSR